MELLRFSVHYFLHLLAPGILAMFLFRNKWGKAWLIMITTMLVDLDHLWADPVFDASRCSIGFHPLHSFIAMFCYAILAIYPKTRIVGAGLLLHMMTDWQDCLWI